MAKTVNWREESLAKIRMAAARVKTLEANLRSLRSAPPFCFGPPPNIDRGAWFGLETAGSKRAREAWDAMMDVVKRSNDRLTSRIFELEREVAGAVRDLLETIDEHT